MDGDWFGAERGAAGTVVFPMVAEGVAHCSRGKSRRSRSRGDRSDAIIPDILQVLGSSDAKEVEAVRRDKGELHGEFLFVAVEEVNDDDPGNLIDRGAKVVSLLTEGAKAIPQETGNGRRAASRKVDVVTGFLHYHNICCI